MKYHKHIIKIVPEDLGYETPKENRVYEIYNEKGEYVQVCINLDNAKEYIDSGYDDNILY